MSTFCYPDARLPDGFTPPSAALAPPEPPPYAPNLDAIRWIEDPDHGPSRPRAWRCLFRCPHKRGRRP